MLKLIGVVLSLIWGMPVAWGQHYEYQALLPPVRAAGFYKIAITPAVAARLQTSFADIRLYGPAQHEVPYVLQREQAVRQRPTSRSHQPEYTPVPRVKFTQTDSATRKQTFIYFKNKAPVFADRIAFKITGPAYYLRTGTLYAVQTQKKRRRTYQTYEPVITFRLQSDQENAFNLNNFKSDDFYLILNNQDNPPLQINNIQFYFRNTYLIASLQPGKTYYLAFGNSKAPHPQYDLAYFQDSIPVNLPLITPSGIKPLVNPAAQKTATIFTDRKIIWVALVLVIGLLGFLTYRLLQETSKKPE